MSSIRIVSLPYKTAAFIQLVRASLPLRKRSFTTSHPSTCMQHDVSHGIDAVLHGPAVPPFWTDIHGAEAVGNPIECFSAETKCAPKAPRIQYAANYAQSRTPHSVRRIDLHGTQRCWEIRAKPNKE